MRRVVVAAALAALALPAAAAPPAGAQESATQLVMSLRLRNSGNALLGRMIYNCQLLGPNGWSLPETRSRYTFTGTQGTPIGVLDPVRRRGAAYVRNGGLQVEQLFARRPNAVAFADLGVELRGSTMYLTGRITRGRPTTGAARRVRLAVARRAKFESGPLVDSRERPVPSTFSFIVTGTLRFLPALSRAFERTRCKDSRNTASRPFRPGYPIGALTVGLRPDVAVGLEGTAHVTPDIRDVETDAPVAVEPGAGATRGSGGVLVMPLASGAPLACLAGVYCIPGSGDVGLAGFDLAYNGRRASVANMVLSTTRTDAGSVEQTVNATLDGAPVVVAAGERLLERPPVRAIPLTSDFAQRAGAALGASITGDLRLEFFFTRTGPA